MSAGFIDETWYPLQLYDKIQDITEFSKAITRAIAAEQHFSIQLIDSDSENLFSGLDNEDYEGVLSSLLMLEGDIEEYIFSGPYYLIGPVLVVPTSSPIKTIRDLKGKSIGVITGSQPVSSLNANTSINFVYYDYNNHSKLIDDVINHVLDGMILDMMTAYEYTKSGLYQGLLKIASSALDS